MNDITIIELVRNGTLNAPIAAVLWAAAEAQVSFLTVAVPRGAGKSTLSNAVLALRPPGTPRIEVYGASGELDHLKQERRGGYIVVAEFSRAPMPGYLWGRPVQRVFETVIEGGYSLQACLHAGSVEGAMREVTMGNGISDAHASTFKLVLYINVDRAPEGGYRRRLAELFELHGVEDGLPIGHPLFRWRADDDSFQQLSPPHQFGRDAEDLEARAKIIEALAGEGRTSPADLEAALSAYRTRRNGSS